MPFGGGGGFELGLFWIPRLYAGFCVASFRTERVPGKAPGEIAGCVLSAFLAESVEIMQDSASSAFAPRGFLARLQVKLQDVCSLLS